MFQTSCENNTAVTGKKRPAFKNKPGAIAKKQKLLEMNIVCLCCGELNVNKGIFTF